MLNTIGRAARSIMTAVPKSSIRSREVSMTGVSRSDDERDRRPSAPTDSVYCRSSR